MGKKMGKTNAISLVGTCPRCHESVDLVITKKQVKALLRGFKCGDTSKAEIAVEMYLGRDKKGELKH